MDTGYKSPTATGAYANTWTNPTNAYSSNDTYAIATALEGQDYQDYDFGIPEGATINGIEVSVESYVSSSTSLTVSLSYDNYSHAATPKYILMEESESSLVVGGATDTWGRDWTVSEFSNANFGSYFYLNYDVTAYIDHIKIKVYYTEFSSSSSSTSFSSSCSSSFSSSSFSSSSFSSCSSSSDSNWSSCSSSSCLSSSSSSSFSSSSSSFSSSSCSSSFSSSSFSSCSSSLSSSSSESNSGNITFNGYDLQTATDTANTILTRNILYRHIPDKVINIKQDTIRDGFDVLDVQYSQKMISLNGWLISDSSANLRTLKNTFHNKLRQTEKNLIINDGGININYICTLRSLDVPEEHWNITQIPYNAEFLCKPFGKLTSTTTINLNSGVNVTTSPYNETISFTGSYCSKPVITFTLAGALITNMTALKLTNNTTSDWIEIARDFSISDVLVIDCEDETVEVNGVNVDFTGVFPVFEEGSNILSIIVTATSFSYTCSLVYYPTYL